MCDETCALVTGERGKFELYTSNGQGATNLNYYYSSTAATVGSADSNLNICSPSSPEIMSSPEPPTAGSSEAWFSKSKRPHAPLQARQSADSLASVTKDDALPNGSGAPPMGSELKLAVLGAPRVGKTALVNQFLCKVFISDYIPTVDDFNWIEFEKNGGILMVKIIDTSGSRDFLAMRNLYVRTSEAFLLVFAVDDLDSFAEVVQLYKEIKENNLRNPAIQVVGTKIDLFEDEENWTVSRDSIARFISQNRVSLAEVSAKNPEDVDQVFRQVLHQSSAGLKMGGEGDALKKRRQSMPAVMSHRGGLPNLSKADLDKLAALDPTARKKKARTGSCRLS